MLKHILILVAISFFSFNYTYSQTYPTCTTSGSHNHFIQIVDFNELWEEHDDKNDGWDEDGDGDDNYEDKTGNSTPLCVPGETYTVNVTIKDKKHDYIDGWIDWNHDGDFEDANEKFTQIANDVNHDGPYSGTITVPSGQSYFGVTRMRIALRKNSRPPTNADATYSDAGEVEDFDIDVVRLKDKFYYVSDDQDELYAIDISNGNGIEYYYTNVSDIEAIAYWPSYTNPVLYAADAGDFGYIDTETSNFTLIGEIDGGGTANGSEGAQSLDDVDGLGFDARTGILWASNRRSGDYDLLFQIDPSTGHFVENAFGNNVDYVEIDGSGVYQYFDDIAISPVDGKIYGVSNDGSNDQLLEIDQFTGAINVNTAISGASDCEGLSFSNDGVLYTSSGSSDEIYSLNVSSGAATYLYDLDGGDVEAISALMDRGNRITGKLWKDDDADGIKDAGETTYLSGVTVELWYDSNNDGDVDGGDEFLQSTTTDASGDYSFDYATTGHLVLRIDESTLPSGYALTTDNKEEADFSSQGNLETGNNFGALDGSDCDGDGIPDFKEGTADTDGDGVQNQCDKDSDNDGILDSEEGTKDTDGDGIPDYLDLDSDNDGIPDAKEANGGSAPASYTSSGRIGGSVDSDGLPTAVYSGGTSNLPNYDTDGDGVKDYRDLDSDNDGILDIVEAGGDDTDGNGVVDSFADSNNDGYHDAYVSSPLPVPNNDSSTEAVNLPNYRDVDSDGDSIDDTREGYSPADYTSPTVIKDNDGDGILNLWDNSSGGASIDPYDFDGDGVPDYLDQDSDDDSGSDMVEGNDADGDGVADSSPSGSDVNKNGLDDTFDKDCKGESALEYYATSKCEEKASNGKCNTSSSDIELVYDGHQQVVGIRFTGVDIDQGTTINSAYIQFTDDEGGTGTVNLTIRGEDRNNASDFSTSDYDVSDRTTTSASVSWSPNDWSNNGESGSDQETPNLRTIVQEIVDRGGWSNGNAMVFIIEGTSTSNTRTATYRDGKPELIIKTADGLKYNCGSDIALNDLNSNSQKDFRDVNETLPVVLIRFKAEIVGEHVELNWTTASEENNDYFVVEKSQDNIYFEEIDRVEGAGNSNVILNYQSVDYNLSDGVTYYRLKQVDYDSKFSLSDVISVVDNPDNEVTIFPNPSNGNMNIKTKEDVDVCIYSVSGQELEHYHFNANTINKIDISKHPKGLYFMSYITNDKRVVKKLIVR